MSGILGGRQRVYVPNSRINDDLNGCAVDIYDFSIHGGAVSTINLPIEIPNGAVIIGAYVDVLTPVTSGGSATIALGLNTNTDVLAATAIGSFTGVIVAKAQAASFKLTASRRLKATIATAALTAGKFAVYVEWVGPFNTIVSR